MLSLTACGGGSSNNSPAETKATVASLAGIWDVGGDGGTEGKDESYMVIDSNGSVSIYDYAGDSFDNEGNCYWIEKT